MTTGTIDPASKSHLPDFNSAASVPGLSGKVDLRRDTWGIPHVRAASHLDAFSGLGFAHAQDRLWQM
jgi:penicillin amidase